MRARTSSIIKTLQAKPNMGTLVQTLMHEGLTDGMGYEVKHVQPGRGFSCTEYSEKMMPNGTIVFCRTYYPGPYDALAGYPSDVVTEYSVGVAWERYTERQDEFDSPYLVRRPEGLVRWDSTAYDGPCYWYAVFSDVGVAEAYAISHPPPDSASIRPDVVYADWD